MAKRVLIWVESYRGAGHLAVAIKVAEALSSAGLHVSLATSNVDRNGKHKDYGLIGKGLSLLPLPGFSDYSGTVTESGLEQRFDTVWCEQRRNILSKAFRDQSFDAVILESWPFTKSPQHDSELEELLELAHGSKAQVYTVVRDILSTSPWLDPEKQHRKGMWGGSPEALVRNLQSSKMKVIVRGDDQLHPFQHTFPLTGQIRHLMESPGYFVDSAVQKNNHLYTEDKPVLLSVGGWFFPDALQFYRTWLKARKHMGSLARNPWILFVPPSASREEFTQIATLAESETTGNIQVFKNGLQFRRLLPAAALSLNSGGYNTCMEAIAHETPFVVVPVGGTEQLIRGTTLKQHGLAGLASIVKRSDTSSDRVDPTVAEQWGAIARRTYEQRAHLRNHRIQLDGAQRFALSVKADLEQRPSRNTVAWSSPDVTRLPRQRPLMQALVLDWDDTSIDSGDCVDLSFARAIATMTSLGYKARHAWTLANKRDRSAPYLPSEFFAQMYGDDLAGRCAHALQQQYYLDLVASGRVRLVPGLLELLRWCRQTGVSVAIVSNSPYEVVSSVRDRLLGTEFADLITIGPGPDLAAKPDPAMFHMAWKRMKEDSGLPLDLPASIYAIGDSWEKDAVPALQMGFTFVLFACAANRQITPSDDQPVDRVTNHLQFLDLVSNGSSK